MEFEDKVVIVTGASSGIGKTAAEEFAKHGATLVLVGRNQENLAKAADVCKKNGAKHVHQIAAEFENLSDVDKIVKQTNEKFNRIDVLVNNAGIMIPSRLESVKMDDVDIMFDINVKAMLKLTQNAMPYLVESKGTIVNVSSISSQHAFPDILAYNMTKGAMDIFTKTIALEYAPKGVRVNSVNPATVKTSIARSSGLSAEQLEDVYRGQSAKHPLGKIGTTENVAKAILFLASKDSAWTTGHCFVVDGGRSLTVAQ